MSWLSDQTIRELDALNMIESAAAGNREALAETVLLYARTGDSPRLAASVALVAALPLVSGLPPREVLNRYRACLLDERREVVR